MYLGSLGLQCREKLGYCASLGSNKCLRGEFLSDGIPWDETVLVCAAICLKSAILRMCKETEHDMSWNHMIRPITLLVALIGKCLLCAYCYVTNNQSDLLFV